MSSDDKIKITPINKTQLNLTCSQQGGELLLNNLKYNNKKSTKNKKNGQQETVLEKQDDKNIAINQPLHLKTIAEVVQDSLAINRNFKLTKILRHTLKKNKRLGLHKFKFTRKKTNKKPNRIAQSKKYNNQLAVPTNLNSNINPNTHIDKLV